MPYTCQVCFKKFERKNWYDRHSIICVEKTQIISRRQEIDDVPSSFHMYQLLLNMKMEIETLKKTVARLESHDKALQRTDLKNNTRLLLPIDTFYEVWSTLFTVVPRDIYNIIELGYVQGIINIIWGAVDENSPLCLFENDVMVHCKRDGWQTITKTLLRIAVDCIQTQIPIVFETLCPELSDDSTPGFNYDIYIKNITIIMTMPPNIDAFMKSMFKAV